MPTNNVTPDREGRGGGQAGADPGRTRPDASRREASRPGVGVLADRIAAALVHHEPGWRLPRHTTLARRYNVTTAEIDAAVSELATRRLVRRLADGQLYRVSPAEYLIPIEGVPGLVSYVDPMGGHIACRSRQAVWRQVPEDIGWALRIPPQDPGRADPRPLGQPRAVHVEMQPPPPSVARSLRLSAGQPAAMVTARFDDPETGRPMALTIAVFRPDLFRIVLVSGEQPLPDGDERTFSGAWTHAVEDWEP